MRAVGFVPLVVFFIAKSASAQSAEPFADIAVGAGHGSHFIRSETGSTDDVYGIAALLEVRVVSAAGHGGGMRVGGVSEVTLFGGARESLFAIDAHYVYRAVEPREGFHVVPTLFIGPSYQRYSASYEANCFMGCSYSPPADLHSRDHQALGVSAGASLDVHLGRPFVGVDLSGRHGVPLDNDEIQSASGYAVMLRLGATVGAKSEPEKR
jgi:hypothetical protein